MKNKELMNNNKYKAANFKSNEIIERWNHYAETI